MPRREKTDWGSVITVPAKVTWHLQRARSCLRVGRVSRGLSRGKKAITAEGEEPMRGFLDGQPGEFYPEDEV